ncbi:hypothetical protein [Ruminococcus flavefaciens]|uniref:hypothetical protein n=1 Tax=Ruminococcus flavefaciens TaxID=1265 RepID=UPI0026EFB62B|nr:hypothetical protein [Ruminococcus flavefaciens]
MKVREIILDFTSLLDVIMIILFFFVLYSTIDTKNAINNAKEAESNYNNLIIKQQELNDEAARELERNKLIDKNAAANQQALNSFEKGDYLDFYLDVTDNSDNWTLVISFGNKQREINSYETDDIKSSIRDTLKQFGFSTDDTYICILTFDGDQFGTAKVVRMIDDAIESIQREYSGLYFTNSKQVR